MSQKVNKKSWFRFMRWTHFQLSVQTSKCVTRSFSWPNKLKIVWLGKLIPLQIAHWGPSHDYFSTPSKVEEPTLWIFQEKLQAQ